MAKPMAADDIREMTEADIRARITELEVERFRLRFRHFIEAEHPVCQLGHLLEVWV